MTILPSKLGSVTLHVWHAPSLILAKPLHVVVFLSALLLLLKPIRFYSVFVFPFRISHGEVELAMSTPCPHRKFFSRTADVQSTVYSIRTSQRRQTAHVTSVTDSWCRRIFFKRQFQNENIQIVMFVMLSLSRSIVGHVRQCEAARCRTVTMLFAYNNPLMMIRSVSQSHGYAGFPICRYCACTARGALASHILRFIWSITAMSIWDTHFWENPTDKEPMCLCLYSCEVWQPWWATVKLWWKRQAHLLDGLWRPKSTHATAHHPNHCCTAQLFK